MRRPPFVRRHLDTRTLLEYLDGRLDMGARRGVEDHLGGPCAACRDRLREIGWLVQTMREDRSVPPPESLRSRALEALGARPPLPTATRRAMGDARWLKFALGDHTLEIEVEADSAEAWTMRGRLDLPDPSLHRIEIEAREETRTVWPDAAGRFALDRVPPGEWHIT